MEQLAILKMAYAKAMEDWEKAYDSYAGERKSGASNPLHRTAYINATQRLEDIRALIEREERNAAPSWRLTKWNGKKYVLPQGRTADGESYFRIIAERLAEYENTGLTPDEIMILKKEAEK